MPIIINNFYCSNEVTGRAETLHGPGRAGPKKIGPIPALIPPTHLHYIANTCLHPYESIVEFSITDWISILSYDV